MTPPLVSIIIPVYNGANYMREAIDSALAQTYEHIEIIVVNDGSQDDGATEKIALSYGDRIRYLRKENGGVSSALNYGIDHMNGEYFSWLSHDDVYAPDKVQEQVNLILSRKSADAVVICNMNTINKDSLQIAEAPKDFSKAEMSWKKALIYITQYGANGCALLIPKSAFDKAGRFDENLRYCQDILMWWKIFLTGYNLVFCDYIGVHSRVHGKQLTQTGSALYHHDASYIGDIIADKFAQISDSDNNCLYVYAKGEAVHGNRSVLKKCITAAKEKKLFSAKDRITLCTFSLYGRVRPFIRKAYYKVFRNIKTK